MVLMEKISKSSFIVTVVALSLSITYLPYGLIKRPRVHVGENVVLPEFRPVLEQFRANIESGKDKGSAFSVYLKGKPLIDIWGGYSDMDSGIPWSKFTTAQVFSATKGIAAIVLAMLVDKELLDYNEPVSRYWPEFGQNDKGNITVAMLLSHTAGLSMLDEAISLEDVSQRPWYVEDVLARQRTVWPAGTKKGYHAVTFGLYVEQLIQKIDAKHRTVYQIFKEDIAEPFSVDFSMNVQNDQFYRTSRIHLDSVWNIVWQILTSPNYRNMYYDAVFRPETLTGRTLYSIKDFSKPMTFFNNALIRNLTVLSVGGTGTARGMAKLYSILADGGTFEGKQLLSRHQIQMLSTDRSGLYDVVVQAVTPPFAMGTLILTNPDGNPTFGHTGLGGQVAMADPTMNIGISYLTNHLSVYSVADDPRYTDLERTLYTCLKVYLRTHNDE